MSAAAFERIRRYVPRARRVEELTEEETAMIAASEMPSEYDHLNALLDE